jgi:hypothetical protein
VVPVDPLVGDAVAAKLDDDHEVDGVFRSVNPWRRFLGAAVLAGQVVKLFG